MLAKLIYRPGQLAWTAAGMVADLAGMLAIRRFAGDERSGGTGSLVVTVVTDTLTGGVLIGLSAALGAGTGLLFAIAIAPEMGLLGVTAAQALGRRWRPARIIAAAAGIGTAIASAGSTAGTGC